jgi:hypothetical protein
MCSKARMPLLSQLNTRVISKVQNKLQVAWKRGQKEKWDKNPPKDKGILAKKKAAGYCQNSMFQLGQVGALCQRLWKGNIGLRARGVHHKGGLLQWHQLLNHPTGLIEKSYKNSRLK